MDLPAEEGAGSQHHVVGKKTQPHLGHHTADLILLHHQVIAGLLEYPQVRLILQHVADRRLVQHPVGLRPCGPHRRTLAAVEHAELDAGTIRCPGHGAAQCIDLLHQMAFADTTDGRVAAHLAQRFDVMAEQQGFDSHARSRQRGFGTRMAATYHNHVKTIWKFHRTPRCPASAGRSGKGADYRAGAEKLQLWLNIF